MNNHEYLEQKFGRVRSGRDLEERYVYLVSQIEWMQKHCQITIQGECLLQAIDEIQQRIGECYHEKTY